MTPLDIVQSIGQRVLGIFVGTYVAISGEGCVLRLGRRLGGFYAVVAVQVHT